MLVSEFLSVNTQRLLKPNISLTHSHQKSVPLHPQLKNISTLICTTEQVHHSVADKEGGGGGRKRQKNQFNRIIKPALKTYRVKESGLES